MTTRTAHDRSRLGAFGEAYAARQLVAQGMVLLERNWRCPHGEIDLVLRDQDTLVVCEVKTRRSHRCGSPIESVTPEKHERLRALAELWRDARGLGPCALRVDLVGVLVDGVTVVALDHARGVG